MPASSPRKLVCFPPVDDARYETLLRVATERVAGADEVPPLQIVNCRDDAEAHREVVDADAYFGKITPSLLAAAQRLTWVQTATASLEHYIFPSLVEHPCQMSNMRGLFSDVIAEHVLGYILCFSRNLHTYVRRQVEHRWAPVGGESGRSDFSGGPCFVSSMDRAHRNVRGSVLGIVGFGAIGREVADRALAFGMRVIAVDPYPPAQPPHGIDWVRGLDAFDQLLAESRFVAICAPHTPRTARWFSRDVLRKMRPDAYLINIGRGAIVVLDDLVESLRAGEIAGAALDVFESEPLPADHLLWDFPNVILTPHVAACSVEIAERHLGVLLENVRRFRVGQTPLNLVNKAEWF
ncbi:MAG: D-2-hydroxyacid dehydrogenase [Pirellulales bacterium]